MLRPCRAVGKSVRLRMPVMIYEPAASLASAIRSTSASSSIIRANGGVTIGNRVLMAAHADITSRQHPTALPRWSIDRGRPGRHRGRRVDWRGRRFVLPGVTIGRGAVVAAGAVVTESVAPHHDGRRRPGPLDQAHRSGRADSMKKALVLGSEGNIGVPLVRHLRARGVGRPRGGHPARVARPLRDGRHQSPGGPAAGLRLGTRRGVPAVGDGQPRDLRAGEQPGDFDQPRRHQQRPAAGQARGCARGVLFDL